MKLSAPAHEFFVFDGRVVDRRSLPTQVDIDRPIQGYGLRNDVLLHVFHEIPKRSDARSDSISQHL
jgi:hypothetical protein